MVAKSKRCGKLGHTVTGTQKPKKNWCKVQYFWPLGNERQDILTVQSFNIGK